MVHPHSTNSYLVDAAHSIDGNVLDQEVVVLVLNVGVDHASSKFSRQVLAHLRSGKDNGTECQKGRGFEGKCRKVMKGLVAGG